MTEPAETVDKTFLWRQRIGPDLRDIPITVTWQRRTDEDGAHWEPVKFTIDGGGQRLGPLALSGIRWSYIIATTDPDNAEPAPAPEQDPAAEQEPAPTDGSGWRVVTARPKPAPPSVPTAVDRRQRRGLAFIPDSPVPADGTPLAYIESRLGVRAYNALRRNGYHTVESALKLTEAKLVAMEGIGPVVAAQIRKTMNNYRAAHRRALKRIARP